MTRDCTIMRTRCICTSIEWKNIVICRLNFDWRSFLSRWFRTNSYVEVVKGSIDNEMHSAPHHFPFFFGEGLGDENVIPFVESKQVYTYKIVVCTLCKVILNVSVTGAFKLSTYAKLHWSRAFNNFMGRSNAIKLDICKMLNGFVFQLVHIIRARPSSSSVKKYTCMDVNKCNPW